MQIFDRAKRIAAGGVLSGILILGVAGRPPRADPTGWTTRGRRHDDTAEPLVIHNRV